MMDFVCVLGGCETYVVHHLVRTGLRCAPLTCIVHYGGALCTTVHKGDLCPWERGVAPNICLYWLGGARVHFACLFWTNHEMVHNTMLSVKLCVWPPDTNRGSSLVIFKAQMVKPWLILLHARLSVLNCHQSIGFWKSSRYTTWWTTEKSLRSPYSLLFAKSVGPNNFWPWKTYSTL